MSPLLEAIANQKPKLFSVKLDGIEIFRGEFTKNGIQPILNLPIDASKPRWLMTYFLDDNPIPVHSINLQGGTG